MLVFWNKMQYAWAFRDTMRKSYLPDDKEKNKEMQTNKRVAFVRTTLIINEKVENCTSKSEKQWIKTAESRLEMQTTL